MNVYTRLVEITGLATTLVETITVYVRQVGMGRTVQLTLMNAIHLAYVCTVVHVVTRKVRSAVTVPSGGQVTHAISM
jgi:hypothetical protein